MKDLLKIQYHVHGQALRSYGAVPAVLSTHTCIAMQRLIKQGSASSGAEPLLETKMSSRGESSKVDWARK